MTDQNNKALDRSGPFGVDDPAGTGSPESLISRRNVISGLAGTAALGLLGMAGTAQAQEEGGPPFARKDRLPVNVKDYGAAGDGETDDQAAIQSAIDDVSEAGGGTVFFPAGTYAISSAVNVATPYVVLAGEGVASEILRREGNRDRYLITFVGPSERPGAFIRYNALRHLSVQGEEASEDASEGAVLFQNAAEFFIEGCWIRGHNGPGISLTDAYIGYITDCHIFRCVDGIEMVGLCNAFRLTNSWLGFNIGVALRFPDGSTSPAGFSGRANGTNIIGSTIEYNGGEGILFTDGDYNGINISGNYFEVNYNPKLTDSKGPTIHKTASGGILVGLTIMSNKFAHISTQQPIQVAIEEGTFGILAANSFKFAGEYVDGYRFGEGVDRWIINQGDSALQLIGDAEVTDSANGVILRSPNDTRYRVRVTDDGTLSTEEV